VKGQADDRQGPYEIKEAAVEHGRDMTRNSKAEHIIRRLDGRIHERNSYGNDPRNIPGSPCSLLGLLSSGRAHRGMPGCSRCRRAAQWVAPATARKAGMPRIAEG
jgi:hypothetical protein